MLVEAAPANIALFNGTTGAPPGGQATSPVLPERSHYFDAGVDQKIPLWLRRAGRPGLRHPRTWRGRLLQIVTDLLDNGNFGQALVLSAFNYAKASMKASSSARNSTTGNFQAYANVAVAQERATDVVSNQYPVQ